ncbi:MAG TPA: hypothetical protein VHD36_12465 [Pirellulales bacterium]|nr:hypothetical protein [Pirellulales bacterium]
MNYAIYDTDSEQRAARYRVSRVLKEGWAVLITAEVLCLSNVIEFVRMKSRKNGFHQTPIQATCCPSSSAATHTNDGSSIGKLMEKPGRNGMPSLIDTVESPT